MKSHLLMFIGTDCPHCDAMRPLVAKLRFETGLVVEERDVWKSEAEYRVLENYQAATGDEECVGIPFFYNQETGAYRCGEINYKSLLKWANGS